MGLSQGLAGCMGGFHSPDDIVIDCCSGGCFSSNRITNDSGNVNGDVILAMERNLISKYMRSTNPKKETLLIVHLLSYYLLL